MDRPLPLAPGVAPTPSWAIRASGEMISSYRKPQRRLSLTKWDLDPTGVTGYYTHLGSCHGPAGGAPSAGVGGGVPAERTPRVTPPNLARRGEIVNKLKKTKNPPLEPAPISGLYLDLQKGVRWALHGKGGVRYYAPTTTRRVNEKNVRIVGTIAIRG